MTFEIANALYGYFETLYITNQRLIRVCGFDIMTKLESGTQEILRVIQDIPRLIPYEYNLKEQELRLKDKNGLMEFAGNLLYLRLDYESILEKHYEFIDKIRNIRNKYEHRMHDIEWKGSTSGNPCLFGYTFRVGEAVVDISAGECIKLLKDLNVLFHKLAKDVERYMYAEGKQEYAYYKKLERFDFLDFNRVYESDLLRIVGKIMYDF